MAFWGVEVKPGAPHSHRFDKNRGRLHVSQATLGIGSSKKKTLVQCNVGNKTPILLCSLLPDKNETCPLDIEFEEEDEVVFSVLGPQSVHLAGYFLDTGANFEGDEDESDSYGEDIGMSDSERSTDSEPDTADEYDDEFSDDDMEMFLPSHKPKSGVVIEEILDDEKPANGNADQKRSKKKKQEKDSDAADDMKKIIGGGSTIFGSESEDEDGLPISSHSKSKKETVEVQAESGKKVSKGSRKKSEDGDDHTIGAKRKIEEALAGPTKRDIEKASDSHLPSSEVEEVNEEKPTKKKKKERAKKEKNHGNREDNVVDIHQEAQVEEVKMDEITHKEPLRDGADENSLNDKGVKFDGNQVADKDATEKKKKKKKKKKDKTPEGDKSANTEEAGKESVVESEDMKAETKPQKVRSYDNGLVIEELEMGKPATGTRASPGNKVSVHYIGKLKKNGKVFDSNIRGCNAPFQFRLGVGKVIKGWDVGVNGMRIGDKRRITVPPSMGYGTKGCGQIPPNAWLVFDVELVAVH